MNAALSLKNFARGGKTYHDHRIEIVRTLFEDNPKVSELGDYLSRSLFTVRSGWRPFAFSSKDWDIANRLLVQKRPDLDARMLDVAMAYISANASSIARMQELGDAVTGQILGYDNSLIRVPTEALSSDEWQSLFGFKILCATNEQSSQNMHAALNAVIGQNEWCRSRLMYPLINQTINRTQPDAIDSFLEYFMFGGECAVEKVALKLLLHHDAARDAPLAFKLFVAMMGHPFDTLEILLDHLEFVLGRDGRLAPAAQRSLDALMTIFPNSRVADVANIQELATHSSDTSSSQMHFSNRLKRYGLGNRELETLTAFASLGHFEQLPTGELLRPIEILCSMRATEYPKPEQFRDITIIVSLWSFLDAGRILCALLRSLFMIDRTAQSIEGRDVLRLTSLYGGLNPFLITAPSAVPVLRRVVEDRPAGAGKLVTIIGEAELRLGEVRQEQRLWINHLQWRLRSLEETGHITKWLEVVRSEARLRPLYLTGINWPWVQEVLHQQKLKPFRSFDGAYMLLLAELETRADPQLLKLVLDKLLVGLATPDVVDRLIDEFGDSAPAFVTRYLTTSNLLSSGRAANHFAALTQRIEALEACIRRLGYNAALSREIYESETRVLTNELLLLNVNAGKFEVPWDLFAKDAEEKHRDEWETFGNLRQAASEEALSAFVETPWLFRNGHREDYRYRRNDALLFQLIVSLVEDFLDHPAFGLEIILSSRFRHNNLLQELHAAIAAVASSTIHPVVPANTKKLATEYRRIVERVLFNWCTDFLQTRRSNKPNAIFHLIPSSDDVDAIFRSLERDAELSKLIGVAVDWIKAKLRPQVEAAGTKFATDMKRELELAFAQTLEQQIQECDGSYRPDDARRVHQAVLNAIQRRIDALQSWFDGVDTSNSAPVSLAQLAQATEALFENVVPDRELAIETDLEGAATTFEPSEVKVAFDLIREIAFNALKHASQPDVSLKVQRQPGDGPITFSFCNACGDGNDSGRVAGARYVSEEEALTREGNSGRLKIAASAATLLGRDLSIEWSMQDGRYELLVPIRISPTEVQAA